MEKRQKLINIFKDRIQEKTSMPYTVTLIGTLDEIIEEILDILV